MNCRYQLGMEEVLTRSRYGQVVLADSSTHQVGAKVLQVHELDSHHLVQRNALGQPDLHSRCNQTSRAMHIV